MREILTRDARPRGTSVREVLPQGKRYAFVIGIDAYRKPIKALKNAVNDAEAISEMLSDDFGFAHSVENLSAIEFGQDTVR